MSKLSAWFAIHHVCLLVIPKIVVGIQPTVLKLSGSLRLVINAMVPLSRWARMDQYLRSSSRLLLLGRRCSGLYSSTRLYSFIAVTGFWYQSKLLEKVAKLTLLHLDTVFVGVIMFTWGGMLAYNTLG